jgi:hypothetical protein
MLKNESRPLYRLRGGAFPGALSKVLFEEEKKKEELAEIPKNVVPHSNCTTANHDSSLC